MIRGALVLLLTLTASLSAQRYEFASIAESSSDGFFIFGSGVAINNNGRVAFAAQARGGSPGLYTGDGGPITTIVPPNTRTIGAVSSINEAGVVAFTADDLPRGVVVGVYNGDGGPIQAILETTEDEEVLGVDPLTVVSINNSGETAFGGIADSGAAIFISGEQGIRPVAFTLEEASRSPLFGVAMNESGQVAFARLFPASFLTARDGVIEVLSDEDAGTVFVPLTARPAINDHGAVAFADLRRTGSVLVVVTDGQERSIADERAGYNEFQAVSINNQGTVAFSASTSRFTFGIYTGSDPEATKVIETGDTLFGGRVTSVELARVITEFLNDEGQIAFKYRIFHPQRGDVEGIAVATPAGLPPVLSENSIINAASFTLPGEIGGAPAPGSMVSIYGSEFASKLTVAAGSPLPTTLDGVTVEFDGIAAPLFFISAGQINAQLPFEVAGATSSVRVFSINGVSEARTLAVATLSPAIYTLNQSGSGQGIVVFADTATIAGPLGVTADSQPARTGDALTIFANGLGAVDPPIASGQNSCDPVGVCAADFSNLVLRRAAARPSLVIGGVVVPDENVLFAGLAPQFVGLYQINFVLPDGIVIGDARPIVIRQGQGRGRVTSRADVTLAVR